MIDVAFVGCGRGQEANYRALAILDGVRISGHCDLDAAQAEAAAHCYGGEAFTHYNDMLEKLRPKALYVAVPPYARGEIECAAAQLGIHLFLEKPVALDRDTARRIGSAVRKSGIICAVGYAFRYYDTAHRAREILKGLPISLITGVWRTGLPLASWGHRMAYSGGQVLDEATQLVDLIRFLCGEVAEVYAAGSSGCMSQIKDYDIYDSCAVAMRMKAGAVAALSTTCVTPLDEHSHLDITTPESSLTFSAGALTVRESGKTTEFLPQVHIHQEASSAFLDAVRTGKRNRIRSTYADALKTFLVTGAINESLESGMPVTLSR